jgi:hypothetical protein
VNDSDNNNSSSNVASTSSSSSSWGDFSTRTPQRGSAIVNSPLSSPATPTTPETQALVSAIDSLSSYFASPPSVQRVPQPPSGPSNRLYQSYQTNFEKEDTSIWHDAHPPVLQFWVDGKPLLDRSCKFKRVEPRHTLIFHSLFFSLICYDNNSSSI